MNETLLNVLAGAGIAMPLAILGGLYAVANAIKSLAATVDRMTKQRALFKPFGVLPVVTTDPVGDDRDNQRRDRKSGKQGRGHGALAWDGALGGEAVTAWLSMNARTRWTTRVRGSRPARKLRTKLGSPTAFRPNVDGGIPVSSRWASTFVRSSTGPNIGPL